MYQTGGRVQISSGDLGTKVSLLEDYDSTMHLLSTFENIFVPLVFHTQSQKNHHHIFLLINRILHIYCSILANAEF